MVAGEGTEDVISLSGYGPDMESFNGVLAAAQEVGGTLGTNVLIILGNDRTLTINYVTIADLHVDDFIFG